MTAFRYWRLSISKWRAAGADGTSASTRVAEMQFVKVDNSLWPTASMTSASAPAPYVVSASSEYSGYPAWGAFDGILADSGRWLSGGGGTAEWLTMDMGTTQEFNRVRIAPDGAVTSGGGYIMLDFRVSGSNTGMFTGEQTLFLDVVGASTGWTASTLREFALTEALPSVASASLALPVLAVGASGGANALGGLPVLTVSAFGGAGSAALIPVLLVSVAGGSSVSAQFPALIQNISGGPGILQGSTNPLPTLLAAALGGANTSSLLPSLTSFASATFFGWAQSAALLPALQAMAAGTNGVIGSGSVSLPMFGASGNGGANAAGTLPALSASSGSTVGGIATVLVSLPRLLTGLAGSRQGLATLAVSLPMLRATNSGVLRVTLPGLDAVAYAYASVTYSYEAYAVNLNHKEHPGIIPTDEVTRYTNFPFDKIIRFKGDYYGVSANGLFLLGGDTDAGTPIPWAWKTFESDFKTPQKKTLLSSYLSGRIGPAMALTLYVGEKGSISYSYTSPRGPDVQNYRQVFGRGIQSRYFALGAAGTGAFALDSLDFDTVTLSRRI